MKRLVLAIALIAATTPFVCGQRQEEITLSAQLTYAKVDAKIKKAISELDPCSTNEQVREKRNKLVALEAEVSKLVAVKTPEAYEADYQKIMNPEAVPSMRAMEIWLVPTTDKASTDPAQKQVLLSLSGSDSFDREIKVSASASYPFGTMPSEKKFWKGDFDPNIFSPRCSYSIPSVDIAYDDKWDATSGQASKLTQQYTGEIVNLSNLLGGLHTAVTFAGYHDSAQGIRYDTEESIGAYGKWHLPIPDIDLSGSDNPNFVIVSLAGEWDTQKTDGEKQASQLGGLRTYVLARYQRDKESRSHIGFNLRGFLPFVDTIDNGHASAMFMWERSLDKTKQWTLTFKTVDTYYSTVPAKYSHNALNPTIGIAYKPKLGD